MEENKLLSESKQEYFCMNETMIKILGFDKADTKWDREISENKIRVLEALYNNSNDAGVGHLYGTDLANLSGINTRNIPNYMNRLEKQGLIVRDYEYEGAKYKKKYVFTEFFYNTAEKAGIKPTKKPRSIIETGDGLTDKERSEFLAKKARKYRENSLELQEYKMMMERLKETKALKIKMERYERLAQEIWENMKKSTA